MIVGLFGGCVYFSVNDSWFEVFELVCDCVVVCWHVSVCCFVIVAVVVVI